MPDRKAGITMRRLAIFVEGYTELLFTDRVIQEIADKNNLAIQLRKIRGGANISKKYIELQVPTSIDGKTLYVLIIDCGGEHLVPQRIREEHKSLTNAGYEKIIGLRDVYPKFTKAEIPKLRTAMKYAIKTSLAPVQIILSVMEIEAWFLAEHNHFPLIDPAITVESISSTLGFNPKLDDMSDRAAPADDMIAAYAIGGQLYKKGAAESTLAKLDYDYMYGSLKDRVSDLAEFFDAIDAFVT
jgi:hypothetical protein